MANAEISFFSECGGTAVTTEEVYDKNSNDTTLNFYSIYKSLLFPGLLHSETWNLTNFLSIHISHNTVGSRDCHQPWRMVLIPTQLRKYHLNSCLSHPARPLRYPLPSSLPCDNLPIICYFLDVCGKGTLNWMKIFSVQGICFQLLLEMPSYSTWKCTQVMIRVQKQNRKDLGNKIQPSLKWAWKGIVHLLLCKIVLLVLNLILTN